MDARYLEDFKVGDRFETAGKTFSEAEILDFALKYDPQPFHMDVEAAKKSIYGGLISSGLHSLCIMLRMIMQEGVFQGSSLGSPGIDELRWLKPVYPGDTLHVVVEVLEVRPSSSKPDRGIVIFRYDCVNQRDEVAMTCRVPQMIKRRAAA